MKNLLIICTIFLHFAFGQNLTAQILKGSIPLSGSLSLRNNDYSAQDTLQSGIGRNSYYSISPSIGYFIADNFTIGLGISYSHDKSYSENKYIYSGDYINNTTIQENLQFTPHLHYYIRLSDKSYFSVNGSFGYSIPLSYINKTEIYFGTNLTTTENKKVSSYSIQASVAPGILYFLNDKFALQGSFGSLYYNYYHSQNNNVSYSNYKGTATSGLNLNLSAFGLGIQYFLVKNKKANNISE